MPKPTELDFVLVGNAEEGGTVYVCRPGKERNLWMAYDLRPDGRFTNPRVVFGEEREIGWRGLQELV